jgi:uncharacterized protein (TIGR03435 family)
MKDTAHVGLLTVVFVSTMALAQQPSGGQTFDVATIKENKSGPGPAFALMLLPGGRVFAQNVSVRDLVRAAHALEESQLEGGPAWTRSTRFDLEARAGGDVTIDTARAMTQKLIAERFRLAAHTETRQLPLYELVMARDDRSLARGIRASGQDCAPVTLPSGMPPAPPPPAGGGIPIGTGGFGCPSGLLPGHLSLRSVDMPAFASVLWRRAVHRPIVDRTGLTGRFDIDLTYLPELENINGRPASDSPFLPAQVTGAPSVFTAVQEQLGLKLEAARGPVEVMVIDRIERPTEN